MDQIGNERVAESQNILGDDVKYGADPAIDGIPHYWDNLGNERPVNVAIFALTRTNPIESNTLSHLIHPFEPVHTEVHVGNTAYSVFALKDGVQKIASRPVEISQKFVKRYPKENLHYMCATRRTDTEIYEYLKANFRGLYHITDFNCNHFSKFLLEFICPGVSFPSQYGFFAYIGKGLHLTYKALERIAPPVKHSLGKLDSAGYFGSAETDQNKPWPWLDLGHKIPKVDGYDSDGYDYE